MDPKTKRFDPGIPSECERLIERGHIALIAITSEAHAARVEAQKAELEVALSEARSGDANMLRGWLENYRGMSESPNLELSTASEPQTPTSSSGLSWDLLVPAARQRLQARSCDLQLVEPGAFAPAALPHKKSLTEDDRAEAQTPLSSELITDRDFEAEHNDGSGEPPNQEQTDRETQDEELLEHDSFDEPTEHKALVYHDLSELQKLSVDRDLGKPLFRSGTRGLAFSVIVHTVLIGTLMAITMRVPDEVASLGFEASASEGTVEAFEVLQPIEVTPMDEIPPEMPSESSETSVSLPSAVGLSSTSANATSPTTASSVSGVQASANRAMAAPSGRPNPANANASFFGAAASGNCFCYVIDGSESMRGGPWEAAKAELLRSLSTMKESHRFYIIFFNQNLNAITMPGEREPATSPLYATPENLKHARNWVESLRIERGAPPNAALLHAIELEPDAIYLLADGATKIDVPEFLRNENRTRDFVSGEQVRVPIHAIAFYSPESGQKLMKQVAAENKGQFIYVPDPRKK